MATNGNDPRLEQLENALRGLAPATMVEAPAVQETPREFSLMELARYFAQHGQEQQEMVKAFATQLLEMERRKLGYIEQIVGRLGQ